MTGTTMQDDTGEAVDPQWLEPLWTDERIDNQVDDFGMGESAKRALIVMRDEYERDRDNFAAVQAYYIGVVERKDATIATQAAKIAQVQADNERLRVELASVERELEEAHESLLRFGEEASYDPLLDGLGVGDYWDNDDEGNA